jgi:hypothetical protein
MMLCAGWSWNQILVGGRDFPCHPKGSFADLLVILQLLLMLRSKVIFGAIFFSGKKKTFYDMGNMVCTNMHSLMMGIGDR